MPTKKQPSKPRTSAKKKAGRGCPGASCSAFAALRENAARLRQSAIERGADEKERYYRGVQDGLRKAQEVVDAASWNPPETAPKHGTIILADFGWAWPVIAIWDLVSGEWSIAQLSPCSEEEPIGWETEWEKNSELKGWLPLPSLPNAESIRHHHNHERP